jgi:hypothetical protein
MCGEIFIATEDAFCCQQYTGYYTLKKCEQVLQCCVLRDYIYVHLGLCKYARLSAAIVAECQALFCVRSRFLPNWSA